MIIGGHAMLGIDAHSFKLQDEFDQTGEAGHARATERGTRLLDIRLDDPGASARGSVGDLLEDDLPTAPSR